jgi:hypothetical protein
MQSAFELGLYTFGDLMPEAAGAQQRVAEILAAAKLTNASGLDVFAVGEHHRLDITVAATPVVLAASAMCASVPSSVGRKSKTHSQSGGSKDQRHRQRPNRPSSAPLSTTSVNFCRAIGVRP